MAHLYIPVQLQKPAKLLLMYITHTWHTYTYQYSYRNQPNCCWCTWLINGTLIYTSTATETSQPCGRVWEWKGSCSMFLTNNFTNRYPTVGCLAPTNVILYSSLSNPWHQYHANSGKEVVHYIFCWSTFPYLIQPLMSWVWHNYDVWDDENTHC